MSHELRAIPNAQFYAEWHNPSTGAQYKKSMPQDVYDSLSQEGKRLCAHIVAPRSSLRLGWKQLGSPDMQGWLTKNKEFHGQHEARLGSSALCAVRVFHQMGNNLESGRKRIGLGIVDLALLFGGRIVEGHLIDVDNSLTRSLTRSTSSTGYTDLLVPAGADIASVVVHERYWYGIVDLELLFKDGTRSQRAFPAIDLNDYRHGGKCVGGRVLETVRLSADKPFQGLAVREQPGYGIIDLKVLYKGAAGADTGILSV